MISEADWGRAVDILLSAQDVAVACHVNPDGDALGSMIAVTHFLRRTNKKVWASWGAPEVDVPPQYEFLPGLELIVPPEEVPDGVEVFLAVDCGDRERLELLEPKFGTATVGINLDHHKSNTLFGEVNLVDPVRASSSEIVVELIRRLGGKPDAVEATCLYAGIVTDTGRFQFSNTTPETLRMAADLRDAGVDHEQIGVEVYGSNTFAYLHVLGTVLSRARLEDGVVWSWVDQADLGELSMDETEQFIDELRKVREAKLAVLLKERPEGGYKASLRSRGEVDVSAVAKAFGGGGHERAAGFTVEIGSPEQIVESVKLHATAG